MRSPSFPNLRNQSILIADKPFTMDADIIDRRLKARLSLSELFGIALAIGILGIFIWLQVIEVYLPVDYGNYMRTVHGDYQYHYYASWAVPFYHLFGWLPGPTGFALWGLINIISVFYAARVFGGKPALVLVSYQMLYTLFYGQITGMLIGCLALSWWAMAHKRWDIAGLGLILGATKFQIGLAFGGILWLVADISWRERFRMLLVPVIGFCLSIVIDPSWIPSLYQRMINNPANDFGSISLWRWMGPFALLVFILPMVIPSLTRYERGIAFFAAASLGLPYFQQSDLISLFVFPVGWIPLLGYFGMLVGKFGWQVLPLFAIIPLCLLLIMFIRGMKRWIAAVRSKPTAIISQSS